MPKKMDKRNSSYDPKGPSPLHEVGLTDSKYIKMVKQSREGKLPRRSRSKLQDGLFVKFCHCIRKVGAESKKGKRSTRKRSGDRGKNPYALCRHSIYNNRGIEPSMRFKGKKLKQKSLPKNCYEELGR